MKMKKTIMIIDDDKEFLEELRETLALSGYALVAVNDATEALSMAAQVKPALILLDLRMPKKSGFEIADDLRRMPEFQNIPIIAMSAFYNEEYGPLIKMCGIKRCLTKPFNPLDVIAEIEAALQ
jgi:CheY-like chemotaxis protein